MAKDDSHIDRVIALKKKMAAQADPDTGEPDWQDDTLEPVPCYQLVLGDAVTTWCGGVSIEVVENDDSLSSTTFNIHAQLGPVNAQRVIDFLKTLPPEPEDDEPETH